MEHLFKGNRDPGPDRLMAAVDAGIPMVLAPCGLDILSYGGRADMLEKTKDRVQYVQDALRVQVRTTADELRQAADVIARAAQRGARRRGPFWCRSRAGRRWTRRAGRSTTRWPTPPSSQRLKQRLDEPGRVKELDLHLYTPEFARAAVDEFVAPVRTGAHAAAGHGGASHDRAPLDAGRPGGRSPATRWSPRPSASSSENNLHALPVVDDGRLRGLVTRANLLRMGHFVLRTQNPDEFDYFVTRLKVRDVMVRNPATVQAERHDAALPASRARQLGVAQFPVLDGERVVGVISANEIFQLAAHCLGAWERRSGLTLAPVGSVPACSAASPTSPKAPARCCRRCIRSGAHERHARWRRRAGAQGRRCASMRATWRDVVAALEAAGLRRARVDRGRAPALAA